MQSGIAAASLCVLAACGADPDAPGAAPTLTWYVGPDRLDATALAATCTDQAAGDYRIEVKQLPTDVTERHALLVRRLLAHDSSIDLLSLDSAWTTELAGAGFLAPVPAARVEGFSAGIAPKALAAATHAGRLVVVPWFLDPQVLWFRGNTAERAGLDTTKPVSWDDLVAGAQRLGVSIEIEDRDGSGLSEWVDALVAGGGGSVVDGGGRDATVGLDSDAGRSAASIVELYHQSGVGPGPSSEALTSFAGPGGGFLLASTSAISDPALSSVQADMVAAPYPTVADTSVAPLAGIGLAVPADAPRPAASFDAITCLTSDPLLETLMTGPQHTASRVATAGAAAVKTGFRSVDVAPKAVAGGATVPATPFWPQVAAALDETWRPVSGVTQDRTPGDSQSAVEAAVRGELR